MKYFFSSVLFVITASSHASFITFNDKDAFLAFLGANAVVEDWTGYSEGTVLSGTTVNGISYPGRSLEPLSVGNLRDDDWILGEPAGKPGTYQGFSNDALMFNFANGITALGITISEDTGNPGGTAPGFSSNFDILVQNTGLFYQRIDYPNDSRYATGFFGIVGIESTSFTMVRTRSDANEEWTLKNIVYSTAQQVDEPATLGVLVLSFLGLLFSRRYPVIKTAK
ncbi:hypothetical protein QTP81_13605 [Alteromonas sp. ASW11-36]|uniref:PEP-CTERM sorting domain-containing protein n=1 Tax=Alteromonas arenosi TaxID=3055817 RepID=A0ABT7SZM9_9ALTE|nr:hypothetical protein [Alteromonas sp. ASW11-36]MDM7861631.1 hypothetical protein [Alteromonas sp. ASW11-36]